MGKSLNFTTDTMGKLKSAVGGTMSELELMKQTNNAMMLGIIESDDQMAELAETAQILAEAVGQDAEYGLESLTTGMGRQSKLMLDNLGIIIEILENKVKSGNVYKSYMIHWFKTGFQSTHGMGQLILINEHFPN